MFAKLLALTAAVVPLATAADTGSARIHNKCDHTVSLWSVGSQVDGPHQIAAHSGSYGETFRKDKVTGGIALKITDAMDGLYTGKPETILAYNIDDDLVYYDLSTVFGTEFDGHKLKVESAKDDCPTLEWDDGTSPGGSQTRACGKKYDVTLTLCA